MQNIQEVNVVKTEAQKRANKKYRMKKLKDGTKKQINATLDIADYNLIDNFCKENNISKAQLIVKSCKLYIESEQAKKNN